VRLLPLDSLNSPAKEVLMSHLELSSLEKYYGETRAAHKQDSDA
jgi:hypothetical protein